MRNMLQATCLLPIILAFANLAAATVRTAYEWKYIDYDWDSTSQKLEAIKSGLYHYANIIPYDVQKLSDGRILLATPRYRKNPASLSIISKKIGFGGSLLAPYPDWSWHNEKDCSGITSVNKVIVDECDRLWVVDSGKIENEQVCSPKILQFDTTTDELVQEVKIPVNLAHNPTNVTQGRLELQTVETTGESCDQTWLYISDLEGYGLVIWDGEDIWRLDDDVYHPDPKRTTFTIAGETVSISQGPKGFVVTPDGFLKERFAIFKPLSSVKGFSASTADLHNSKSGRNVTYYISDYTGIVTGQEITRVFTKTGGIMFGSFPTSLFGCWNVQNRLALPYFGFVSLNPRDMQFVISIKVTLESNGKDQTVMALSNRLQKFLLGTMNFDEVNFRIITADVAFVTTWNVCRPRKNVRVERTIESKGFKVYKGPENSSEYSNWYDGLLNLPKFALDAISATFQ